MSAHRRPLTAWAAWRLHPRTRYLSLAVLFLLPVIVIAFLYTLIGMATVTKRDASAGKAAQWARDLQDSTPVSTPTSFSTLTPGALTTMRWLGAFGTHATSHMWMTSDPPNDHQI